jgi:mRNA interferase MazF
VTSLASTGEIVVVDFPGVQGIKRRPAIIISSAAYHTSRPDIIIGLVTTQLDDATGPTDHVIVNWKAAGLRRPSAFRAFLVTLPRKAVLASIGRPDATDWKAIVPCVNDALAQ